MAADYISPISRAKAGTTRGSNLSSCSGVDTLPSLLLLGNSDSMFRLG